MTGLFEDLAQFDEGIAKNRRKAAAVAQKRVDDRFSAFIKRAGSDPTERSDRLDFISEDVRQIVADVAEQFDVDTERLQDAINEHLKGDGVTDIDGELADAPSAVGHKEAGGHKPGCTCGFCENKGNLPGQDSEDEDEEESEVKEAATKEADAPKDGGGATKRESLPTADPSGLGGPSPKIDKKTWKPNALNEKGNLKPVDTEMSGSPVPTDDIDIKERPDYEGDFLKGTDSVTEHQSLPSAGDSGQSTERNISQEGQGGTWTEAENQPVTASVDPDKNPLRSILESGFVTDHQVESAIRNFEGQKKE